MLENHYNDRKNPQKRVIFDVSQHREFWGYACDVIMKDTQKRTLNSAVLRKVPDYWAKMV
jgi:hypothetical protein